MLKKSFLLKSVPVVSVLLLVLLLTSFASANSACRTVDMTKDLGFHDSKDIAQGNTEWCTSFSEAHLISQKLKQPVSAYDLVFRKSFYSPRKGAMIEGKAYGKTLEKDVIRLFKQEPWVCSQQSYKAVDPMYQNQAFVSHLRNFKAGHCNEIPEQDFFANLNSLSEFQSAAVNSGDVVEYMKNLNEKNCKDKIPFPFQFEKQDVASGWDQIDKQEQTARLVRQTINKGKMISITFDPYFFFNDNASFLQKQKARLGGGHRATVVGMTERDGECFYQIRDSAFGASSVCNEIALGKVSCHGNFNYEVKEADLMKALKTTLTIKD